MMRSKFAFSGKAKSMERQAEICHWRYLCFSRVLEGFDGTGRYFSG